MSRFVLTALAVPLVFGGLLACEPDVPREPATTAIVDAGPTSPEASTESGSPREVLDREFREAYAASRSALLEELRPVIIASGDELILKHGEGGEGKEERETVLLPHYHVPKTATHMPLTAWLLIGPARPENSAEFLGRFKEQLASREEMYAELGEPDEDLKQLEGLKERFEELNTANTNAKERCDEDWGGNYRDVSIKGVVEDVVEKTSTFVDRAIEGRVETGTLDEFIECQKDNIERAIMYATYAQLDKTHAVVSRWRDDIHDVNWKKLNVVVIGPQLPRARNALTQYFSGNPDLEIDDNGPRLVYAETLFYRDIHEIDERALGLLGTHHLDRQIGDEFFGDPKRMTEDILANAAEEWIDNEFGPLPPPEPNPKLAASLRWAPDRGHPPESPARPTVLDRRSSPNAVSARSVDSLEQTLTSK